MKNLSFLWNSFACCFLLLILSVWEFCQLSAQENVPETSSDSKISTESSSSADSKKTTDLEKLTKTENSVDLDKSADSVEVLDSDSLGEDKIPADSQTPGDLNALSESENLKADQSAQNSSDNSKTKNSADSKLPSSEENSGSSSSAVQKEKKTLVSESEQNAPTDISSQSDQYLPSKNTKPIDKTEQINNKGQINKIDQIDKTDQTGKTELLDKTDSVLSTGKNMSSKRVPAPDTELVLVPMRNFPIPFSVDFGDGTDPPKEVELLFTADSGKQWYSYGRVRASSTDNGFFFRAPTDGEYWMILRTWFQSGRKHETPIQRIMIDSKILFRNSLNETSKISDVSGVSDEQTENLSVSSVSEAKYPENSVNSKTSIDLENTTDSKNSVDLENSVDLDSSDVNIVEKTVSGESGGGYQSNKTENSQTENTQTENKPTESIQEENNSVETELPLFPDIIDDFSVDSQTQEQASAISDSNNQNGKKNGSERPIKDDISKRLLAMGGSSRQNLQTADDSGTNGFNVSSDGKEILPNISVKTDKTVGIAGTSAETSTVDGEKTGLSDDQSNFPDIHSSDSRSVQNKKQSASTDSETDNVKQPGDILSIGIGKKDGKPYLIEVRWLTQNEDDSSKILHIERGETLDGPWFPSAVNLQYHRGGYWWKIAEEDKQPFYLRTILVDEQGKLLNVDSPDFRVVADPQWAAALEKQQENGSPSGGGQPGDVQSREGEQGEGLAGNTLSGAENGRFAGNNAVLPNNYSSSSGVINSNNSGAIPNNPNVDRNAGGSMPRGRTVSFPTINGNWVTRVPQAPNYVSVPRYEFVPEDSQNGVSNQNGRYSFNAGQNANSGQNLGQNFEQNFGQNVSGLPSGQVYRGANGTAVIYSQENGAIGQFVGSGLYPGTEAVSNQTVSGNSVSGVQYSGDGNVGGQYLGTQYSGTPNVGTQYPGAQYPGTQYSGMSNAGFQYPGMQYTEQGNAYLNGAGTSSGMSGNSVSGSSARNAAFFATEANRPLPPKPTTVSEPTFYRNR